MAAADAAMAAHEELALLCQSCGMCCDGSLFGRVDLEPREVDAARRHRLPLVSSGKAFAQPCTALVAGGAGLQCSLYDERPLSCRRFVCRLYDRHAREGGPIEARVAVVRRARQLVAALEESGFDPGDLESGRSKGQPTDPRAAGAMAAYLELTHSLEGDFSRVP